MLAKAFLPAATCFLLTILPRLFLTKPPLVKPLKTTARGALGCDRHREVDVAARERRLAARERRHHPVVGVLVRAVVVVELRVVLVRAARAVVVHLRLRGQREALDRAAVLVLDGAGDDGLRRAVLVGDRHRSKVNNRPVDAACVTWS